MYKNFVQLNISTKPIGGAMSNVKISTAEMLSERQKLLSNVQMLRGLTGSRAALANARAWMAWEGVTRVLPC